MALKIKLWLGFFVISVLSITLFIALNNDYIKIGFIKLFRQSIIISHYNKYGQLEGEYSAYIRGKIYLKSFFKNGKSDGLSVWYYENTGKKRHEVYFRKGIVEGIENVYYANGALDYTTQWKNGKHFINEFHYLENGVLNNYNAFDLSKDGDNGYCWVGYDNAGKFHQVLGNVFSSYIYSVCKNSTIALMEDSSYKCLSNLYISVATPPQLKTTIEVLINKINYNKLDIIDNTIAIPGVFYKPGKYEIIIYGKLQTTSGAIVKSDTLKMFLFKE